MSDDETDASPNKVKQDEVTGHEDVLENDEPDEESSAEDEDGHFFKKGQRSEFNKFRQMLRYGEYGKTLAEEMIRRMTIEETFQAKKPKRDKTIRERFDPQIFAENTPTSIPSVPPHKVRSLRKTERIHYEVAQNMRMIYFLLLASDIILDQGSQLSKEDFEAVREMIKVALKEAKFLIQKSTFERLKLSE